jgi:hypothetical protein
VKVRIPQALTPRRLLAAARRMTRACRTYRARRRCPRFELNEQAAREFLARALRRTAGDVEVPVEGESWTLAPGWDLRKIYADETGHVENLVYQAIWETGVITCTHEGVDIDLFIEAPLGGDWMYQWRVSFPPGSQFAICNPYRADFRRLGWFDGERDPKAKGCRTAMAILREAVDYGNQILFAHAVAGGRIPATRHRPPRGIRH